MRKPNLIVFLTDQQRRDTMACYGNYRVHSPNLNRLASESAVFERTYVTQPLCTPSRASLFTGLWPHATNCTRNGVSLDRRYLTFAELLGDQDYHPAYIGKWQLGDELLQQRGFREWISTEGVSDYSRFLSEHGHTPDKANGAFSEDAISNLPLDVAKPAFLEEKACRFIEKHQHDPLILIVSYVEPHSPYNGPLNNEHSLKDIELDPSAVAPASDDIPLRYRLMRQWQQREAVLDRDRLPTLYFFGSSLQEYREIKQRYFGLITMLDRSIGGILGCVERTGLLDHTAIVYTSDHGDMLGAHHLFGKEVMFEEAARVPYLIRMPGQRRELRIAQSISHIDFLPTLFDLLKLPCPTQCQGKSSLPLLRGEMMPPESVFMEWSPNRMKVVKGTRLAKRRAINRAVNESTRAVVLNDGWKLCLRDKDTNELYQLNEDPTEQHNLFYTHNYREVITRGTDEIHRWQERVADPLRV
ncbi:MAG: hypothetical protein DMF04_06690 [Verrucomicrobia bacterium]|nr:MAG: hypothetical protein DMF04_06690 [Verrucomicrobiota bacterium]